MSNSVRPHRQQPTRLPHPWDSPGKSTGVGCRESEVAQSCLTHCDPMDCSLAGSSIHGIFQARVLEWGAIAFSVEDSYAMLKDIIQRNLSYTLLHFLQSQILQNYSVSNQDIYIDPIQSLFRFPQFHQYVCVQFYTISSRMQIPISTNTVKLLTMPSLRAFCRPFTTTPTSLPFPTPTQLISSSRLGSTFFQLLGWRFTFPPPPPQPVEMFLILKDSGSV